MRRTLLLTIDFPPMFGGVANYWANLCRYLAHDKILVLAPECNDSLDFDIKQNYLIFRANLISRQRWLWPKWLPLLLEAWRLVRQEKIERVIAAQVLPAGTVALILKIFLRVPYVISAHGLDLKRPLSSRRKTWLMRKILKSAAAIIANSQFTRRLLKEICSCCAEKTSIVYPCPNIAANNNVKIGELADKLGLRGKKIILTVGRLIERKGQDMVIKAMPKVLKNVPEAVYVIVGNGESLERLKALVHELRLNEQVRFCEDVTDEELPSYFAASDVFVMPCRELPDGDVEGFGIVYLEAGSFAKPVICGECGGAMEAVEKDVTGLWVDPIDIEKISQAIVSLLTDEARAQEMGRTGAERVACQFQWPEQVKKLIAILK